MPMGDGGTAGWEELPPALRMAAMSGRVNPRYTPERRVADEALSSALHEKVSERNATPKYSWDRQESAPSPRQGDRRRATLREEAEAMRRRLAQLEAGGGGRDLPSPTTRATSGGDGVGEPAPAPAGKSGDRSGQDASHQQHSRDTLTKKLQKVEKMLEREAPGTKEHKKLLKKRVEYQNQLREMEEDSGRRNAVDDGNNHDEDSNGAAASPEQARREQLRLEARRKREEAEREAAEQLGMRRRETERKEEEERRRELEREQHRRRLEEERSAAEEAAATAEEERQLRRKEAFREEARRLKQEALEKKQRQEEAAEEAERERREAIREERTRREERLEEARRLKEEATEKRRRQEESGAEAAVAPKSAYETDDQKRKQAFLEEARLLKQQAMEKKRPDALGSTKSAYESDDQKRKEIFLEEARRLKADAMAKKEVEEAEKRAQAEAEEESKLKLREAQREAEEREQKELMEARRLEREGLELQRAVAQEEQAADSSNGHPQEASQGFLDRRALTEPFSENTKKILRELENMESRQKKLEKSLTQNGVPIIEEIPYEVAKDKISEITDSMKELASADMDPYQMEKQYFHLEEQLAKYTTALMLTDEYAEEQKRMEMEWEEKIEADNVEAIRRLRSHMPITIRSMTEEELATIPTPNGKTLQKALARKFKRTNVLQLIRVNPEDIEKMHPSLLEGMRTTGLTLTERRAIHEHLRDVGERWQDRQSDPSAEKKFQWFQGLKAKFKESLDSYTRHIEQYGPPENHPYAQRNDPSGNGCPMIGNQCPLKADAVTDYSEDYGFTQEAEYEVSDAQRSGSSGSMTSSRRSTASVNQNPTKSTITDEELMDKLRKLLRLDRYETDVDKKLLRELFHAEKRTKSLEKQLTQNGLSVSVEDIPYSVARARVAELTEEIKMVAATMGNTSDMKEIARLENEFGMLSKEMDKYNNALMLTKEWAREQEDKERQWEISVSPKNYVALQKIWRHMPVFIRDMSEAHLTSEPTPNGQMIPKAMAKKFKRTNILMLLRMDPASIEPMHPSSLEAMRTTGLTLTERRALHEHLKNVAPKWRSMTSDKMSERKWMWHESLKSKLKEELMKYDKHAEQYGPPENHPYANRNDPSAGGCPLLGNQCPVKADLATDYTGDLGFPDHAEYGTQSVAKSNLLSMEDIERRRREDEMEFGAGYDSGHSGTPSDEAEAAAPALSRPAGPPGGMGGILAAIKKAPPSSEDTPKPPRQGPAGGMGGLLAEINKKKPKEESTAPPGPPRGMGSLLAEIQKAPKDESEAATEFDDGRGDAPAKKRGILAALTGRKKN
jgi:hypothetical protein